MGNIILPLLLGLVSCIVIWRSSDGFEMSADFLGRKLPAGVKGATLNAIASSMPEFLTTMFFLFYLHDAQGFSGGLGVTSGSALFNLVIIPALVVLILAFSQKKQQVFLNKKVLLREGLVLILVQILFIDFLFKGVLLPKHGLILISVYMIYLAFLFWTSKKNKTGDETYEAPKIKSSSSLRRKLLILDLPALILDQRKISRKRAWLLLAASTLLMTAGTWMLVHATDMLGKETGIPLIYLSVVLGAAATSVPDTIISIRDAKKGNLDDAISNALGSNTFDIAFALGLPILLFTLISGEPIKLNPELVDVTQEVWVFLLLATILALAIMYFGKRFRKAKAIVLLVIYAIFLVYIGTQVDRSAINFGDPIAEFLRGIAERIHEFLH